MAEEAVGPDVAELTACGRVVVMPVEGSALPCGHIPLAGFFRAAQLPASAAAAAAAALPLFCTDGAVIVAVELVEAMEDDEFCRWTVLRGAEVNILPTSSGFITPKPLPLDVHPSLVFG